MEDTMEPSIRRRSNGTIDIEHYRTMAENMRRDASIEMMRNARSTIWTIVVYGTTLLTVAIFGRHTTVSQQALHTVWGTQSVREP